MTAPDEFLELFNALPDSQGRRRRWFSSTSMDLVIWQNEKGGMLGFQLCHGKPLQEYALTWTPATGFSHFRVDDGSVDSLGHKATPILKSVAAADIGTLVKQFASACVTLPPPLVKTVIQRLQELQEPSHG